MPVNMPPGNFFTHPHLFVAPNLENQRLYFQRRHKIRMTLVSLGVVLIATGFITSLILDKRNTTWTTAFCLGTSITGLFLCLAPLKLLKTDIDRRNLESRRIKPSISYR